MNSENQLARKTCVLCGHVFLAGLRDEDGIIQWLDVTSHNDPVKFGIPGHRCPTTAQELVNDESEQESK